MADGVEFAVIAAYTIPVVPLILNCFPLDQCVEGTKQVSRCVKQYTFHEHSLATAQFALLIKTRVILLNNWKSYM